MNVPRIDRDAGTVTMLHGTTEANVAAIRREGFRRADPQALAAWVERELALSDGSVLRHFAYEFARNRQDLDHAHFISRLDVARQYAVPEALQDALKAAYFIAHPAALSGKMSRQKTECEHAWIAATAARLVRPAVLAVTMPWRVLGDHAFGRRLLLDEYLAIDPEPPYSAAVPIAALEIARLEEVPLDQGGTT